MQQASIWQQQHPEISVRTQLASEHAWGSSLTHYVVLTAFEELLASVTEGLQTDEIIDETLGLEVTLQRDDAATLTLTLTGLQAEQRHRVLQTEALHHIQSSFHYLTQGSLHQNRGPELSWRFRWLPGKVPSRAG